MSSLNSLNEILTRVRTKNAASKKASEPPSSSHPTDSADNGTISPPSLGSLANEQLSTVKNQGPGNSAEAAGSGSATQASQQISNQGAGFPGDNPAVEKGYEEKPKDPQDTSSPATTDDARKYGSYRGRPVAELRKEAADLANTIMGSISAEGLAQNIQVANKAAASQTVTQANPTPAATAVTPEQVQDLRTKNAQAVIFETIKQAELMADLAGPVLQAEQRKYAAAAALQRVNSLPLSQAPTTKKAEEEESSEGGNEVSPSPDKSDKSDAAGTASGGPASDSGPPEASGDPSAAGGSPEDAIEEFIMALLQNGASPDQIMEALAPLMGPQGGGGGAPPTDPAMAGGAPPMDPAMAGGGAPAPGGPGMEVMAAEKRRRVQTLHKVASAAVARVQEVRRKNNGVFKFKQAKDEAQVARRDELFATAMDILR